MRSNIEAHCSSLMKVATEKAAFCSASFYDSPAP